MQIPGPGGVLNIRWDKQSTERYAFKQSLLSVRLILLEIMALEFKFLKDLCVELNVSYCDSIWVEFIWWG